MTSVSGFWIYGLSMHSNIMSDLDLFVFPHVEIVMYSFPSEGEGHVGHFVQNVKPSP